MAAGTVLGLLQPRHRIVIGEGQYLDSGRRRAGHQLGGGQGAVGAVRMRV